MKKFTSRFISLLLAVLMIGMMLPMTAFAEAGDWDPLTDPDTVYGDLVGTEQFRASTSLDSGKDGYLRMMPILTAGNYDYNAMAYCGATASSNDPDIVDVKSIEIGAWQGGAWDGADCLQVTVNPKSAGTTVVVINFYYTFSQSSSPFTNPKAQWFYGTMRYTVKVNGPVTQDITLSYDANGGAGAPAAQTQTVAAGQNAVFTISSGVPAFDGHTFLGWSLDKDAYAADYQPGGSITLSTSDTLYAVWEEETADTFTVTYTVTYTDGVDGVVVFADDIHPNLTEGTATPPFSGGTPTRPGYVFKGWSPTVPATVTADATYTAQWEKETPKPGNVHIYIYRAGNLSKPAVSTNLDANVGDVLDLGKLDINDYYASSHGFEAAGWFNDGGFNDYKAGRNPSALAELTVSGGWQNLIAVVTDYQRVIVKSVVDGNKDDAADIFDEKVLTGTDLITFLEANVVIQDMEGHTLEKWYNWDWYGHKFGADTPVTGWTNVYVNYVPNEYTVTFDTANGDTPSTVSVKHGQTVVRPADPIKDGCNFVGWFDAAGNIFDFDTPITSDTTLTAKWERADGNIHIYIYRAGDLERPVIHNILEAKVNDTLELTELDINDYYASSQGFESAGWFNDGKFNEYKAGKAPEALSELKVTGQWQNVIAVVADYEKVIVNCK